MLRDTHSTRAVGALLIMICALGSLWATRATSTVAWGVTVPTTELMAALAAAQTTPPKATTTVLVMGDVMLARAVERLSLRAGYDYPFNGVAPFIRDAAADAVVVNFEAAVPARHVPTPNFTYRFSAPVSSVAALAAAGVTHVGLANNHSYDFGLSGYQHTRAVLTDAGLTPFGDQLAGTTSISVIHTDGFSVALVGVYAVDQTPNVPALCREAHAAAADRIVYFVHWGVEYQPTHTAAMEALATELAQCDADLIIGHHPHVVGDIGVVEGVPVLYSLGNLIFDQYFSPAVMEGLAAQVSFTDAATTIVLTPLSAAASLSQPAPLTGAAAARALSQVAAISTSTLASAIASGTLAFPRK